MDFILLGNSARVALPVMQAIHAAGDGRALLVGGADSERLRWSHLCRGHVRADLDDERAVADVLDGLAHAMPRTRLIPYDCQAVRAVNRMRRRITLDVLPVPDTATLDMLDDKWRFQEFCAAHGLPVPPSCWIAAKERLDFGALAGELGVPFVVKPTNCSGSLGVEIIHSGGELEQRILRNPHYRHAPLIAQRHIAGEDMDINVLARHGRLAAISVHRVRGPWLEFLPHPALEQMAATLCRASGYHGVMNIDVRLERGTGAVFLLETNPRFWATLAATVECGLNFVTESARTSWVPGPPRRLTAGRFSTRHPLLRPATWSQLAGGDERARLLRARMFDPYLLGQLALEAPGMAARWLRRRRAAQRGYEPQATA